MHVGSTPTPTPDATSRASIARLLQVLTRNAGPPSLSHQLAIISYSGDGSGMQRMVDWDKDVGSANGSGSATDRQPIQASGASASGSTCMLAKWPGSARMARSSRLCASPSSSTKLLLTVSSTFKRG
ncbi:hypothetical protein D9M72_127740 [compost metagenome]